MSTPSGSIEKGLSWWKPAEGVSSREGPDSRWRRDSCSSSVTAQRWRKRDKAQGLPGRLDGENTHSAGGGKGGWLWLWKGWTSCGKGHKSSTMLLGCTVRDQSSSRGETGPNPIDRWACRSTFSEVKVARREGSGKKGCRTLFLSSWEGK